MGFGWPSNAFSDHIRKLQNSFIVCFEGIGLARFQEFLEALGFITSAFITSSRVASVLHDDDIAFERQLVARRKLRRLQPRCPGRLAALPAGAAWCGEPFATSSALAARSVNERTARVDSAAIVGSSETTRQQSQDAPRRCERLLHRLPARPARIGKVAPEPCRARRHDLPTRVSEAARP